MSVERSFEAWEEVQRHGQDLADRLAQGFNGLIHTHISPPSFPWPNPKKTVVLDVDFSSHSFRKGDFGLSIIDKSGLNGVSAIFDIGNKLGQVGADFGNSLNGMVHQFFRRIPVPFRHEEHHRIDLTLVREDILSAARSGMRMATKEDFELRTEQLRDFGYVANESGEDGLGDEEVSGYNLRSTGHFGRPQGTINMTSTYDSRTNDIESSLLARGDLWRVEASHDSSTSRNNTSSLFLLQLGPVLFVRDSTLLLPVHLSKQHLLWYGYDRKNGMHSLCPAVWTKHRRWLLMSMICLNPLACSFVDLQFPNGQLTYVAGEGFTTSAFLPICGGLLQAQGQYPGDMRFSFSCKNKWGTRITPTLQWPEKSFSMGVVQALAWQRSGIMLRPTVQLSVCPSFGGTNPGLLAEVTHSVKEQLSLIGGCAFTTHPSAFASIAIGRSKWNGNSGSSGIVVKVETPLSNIGRPAFSVQLNSGIEF